MKTAQLKYLAILSGSFLFGLTLAFSSGSLASQGPKVKSSDTREVATNLYEALRASDFDPWGVDRSLMFLQDQNFAENTEYHNHQAPAFQIPQKSSTSVYWGQVAFYSDIYARLNRGRVVNDAYTTSPTGYWFVCDWNGNVQNIPTQDVRFFEILEPGRSSHFKPVFPGMREYATAKPIW